MTQGLKGVLVFSYVVETQQKLNKMMKPRMTFQEEMKKPRMPYQEETKKLIS